jgi:hypothetical protein
MVMPDRPRRVLPGGSTQGHGTRACYISGCRDARCRAANAAYMKHWRDDHPERANPSRYIDYQARR